MSGPNIMANPAQANTIAEIVQSHVHDFVNLSERYGIAEEILSRFVLVPRIVAGDFPDLSDTTNGGAA